jgi:hydroxymethylglutaryl-CoA lyase
VLAGTDIVNVVVCATETFNRRNVSMSVAESMEQTAQIVQLAGEAGVRVTAVLATAYYCPFEGLVPEERVLDLVGRFADLGIVEVTLADTIGAADPAQVFARGVAVRERRPHLDLGIHPHDTRGLGLANALAAMQAGIRRLEASVGGIGGCPFAPKATGALLRISSSCWARSVFHGHPAADRGGLPDIVGTGRADARRRAASARPLPLSETASCR